MNKHTHFLSRFGVPGIVWYLPSQLSNSVPMKVLNIQMKKQTWGEDQTIQPSLRMFCGKVGKPRVGEAVLHLCGSQLQKCLNQLSWLPSFLCWSWGKAAL